jgi:hypothetical protein
VRRVSTLLAGAAAGAIAATVFLRRRRPALAPERLDPRARELREKLAEARNARADEEEFEVAGMAAETAVEEPAAPPRGQQATPEASPPETPKRGEPADEFEAMRRRVHEEGRAAAEAMRRDPDDPEGG